jgi:hypothetical protein
VVLLLRVGKSLLSFEKIKLNYRNYSNSLMNVFTGRDIPTQNVKTNGARLLKVVVVYDIVRLNSILHYCFNVICLNLWAVWIL